MINIGKFLPIVIIFIIGSAILTCKSTESNPTLQGNWTLVLDSLDQGEEEMWFEDFPAGKSMELPGTIDFANLGTLNHIEPSLNNVVLAHVTRNRQYIG